MRMKNCKCNIRAVTWRDSQIVERVWGTCRLKAHKTCWHMGKTFHFISFHRSVIPHIIGHSFEMTSVLYLFSRKRHFSSSSTWTLGEMYSSEKGCDRLGFFNKITKKFIALSRAISLNSWSMFMVSSPILWASKCTLLLFFPQPDGGCIFTLWSCWCRTSG